MAEITVRFDLKFGSRAVRLAMVGAMLLAVVPELASESVTLTTYYPAPSGIYAQLIATGNAYLARDSGNVAVGTTNADATTTSKFTIDTGGAYGTALTVNVSSVKGFAMNPWASGGGYAWTMYDGSGNVWNPGLSQVGGNVGIGTTAPGNKLQVYGSGGGNIDLGVNGRMQTGDGSGSGGVWLSDANNMFVGQDGADLMLWTAGAGAAQLIDQAGESYFANEVQTSNSFTSYLSCGEISFAPNSNAACGGYITTMSGSYARFMTLPIPQGPSGPTNMTTTNAITALCCACPTGGCVL